MLRFWFKLCMHVSRALLWTQCHVCSYGLESSLAEGIYELWSQSKPKLVIVGNWEICFRCILLICNVGVHPVPFLSSPLRSHLLLVLLILTLSLS